MMRSAHAGREADAIAAALGGPVDPVKLEKEIWDLMRTCYDPEIPVNIVDLGLISRLQNRADPGRDRQLPREREDDSDRARLRHGAGAAAGRADETAAPLKSVDDVNAGARLGAWQWNQGMLTEAAKLQLGLM